MTARTNPNAVSAPLPPDTKLYWPVEATIRAEILRAVSELLWATHRHRVAWTKMERLKKEAEANGNSWFMDNQRTWKIATGDVTWWRGEVSARSNTIQAFLAYATMTGMHIMPPDTRSFHEADWTFPDPPK